MENKPVRVRFAPSPTGGLHLGGVRTVLFNYLFAKQHGGTFIVRIEDTDQTRFVEGAEQYIFDCLQWCGLTPDESPVNGGPFAPYRQSERKAIYKQYALQLIEKGYAYYAFDTPEELEAKRKQFPNFQYNHQTRYQCSNSLTLAPEQVLEKLANNTPYVIRIKMPENETVTCNDLIRGKVEFNTGLSDDKVLLKADGMPTYHLAVVVDDYLMQITHAFRGEEWLPSAPIHILLWQYLFGLNNMPQWAHLPLILKPDGNGKLSKRDGERLGFPVFAMDWTDPATGNTTKGFKERGFLPEAFVNMLAMLGWNDGSGQEIFSIDALIEKFSIERIHKGGARFDYEKAKWFNHSWIQQLPVQHYAAEVKKYFSAAGITITHNDYLYRVMELVKERCHLLPDFVEQAGFFFQHPTNVDTNAIAAKWNEAKQQFFAELMRNLELMSIWNAESLENDFKEMAAAHQLKPGELMLPFRIMLVGGKFGPHVFDIAALIGKEATIQRIKHTLQLLTA
ncbi:glutamate--tRNA ligase [Hydrotalea sandarakina]|jgi:glutamyl-tRNA synthetase|uniref:Glutamate--tRNA ligase n=1 Tax=Hydrotalea sandarakina TaxID=1004304 RepID=A0A2W7RVB2_9BACT|nr:glutamate--tRNA ligase [Hydrotalea sandarakina]PZX64638.1 glutamyl-tRNA synthetase [Hydrotalea sandarakina]